MHPSSQFILTLTLVTLLATHSAPAKTVVILTDEEKSALKQATNSVQADELKLPPADMQWWQDARFGMFIHWGLYAIPAQGEWYMHNKKIPADEYAKLASQFNPRHYDPATWASAAKNAGMKYMVLTARHHDGFALWDSPSSYNHFDAKHTAAGRDLIAPYVQAVRNAGLRVGIYYSPMDWRFPGYFHPRELPDNALLMKQQCYGQIQELMSNYGPIDVLWYDGGWLAHSGSDADSAWFWEPIKLNSLVRQFQPKAVISPRSGWTGDFACEEGGGEIKGPVRPHPWEKCLNLNKPSWGFNKTQKLMSRDEILITLVNAAIRNGNTLLNVGPDPDGLLPDTHIARLKEVGDWLARFGPSIYATRGGPLDPVDRVYGTTSRGDTLYVHVLNWPQAGLTLPPIPRKILTCQALTGGTASFHQTDQAITLDLPPADRTAPDTIIALELEPPANPPR